MSKQTTLTSTEIFEKMRDILVDALSVEEEDVALNSKLFPDLGAESIDLLDIAFRTQKVFSVKVDREYHPAALVSEFYNKIQDRDKKSDAQLLEEILPLFEQRLPFPFKAPSDAESIQDLFTVELLCKDVAHRLGIPWSPEELPA